MNIPRQPLNAEYKVNQIGHYKELITGAGSKVFKINPSGAFCGSSNWNSAPLKWDYSGNFYATHGTIAGNFSITGSLRFVSGGIERGEIYADSNGIWVKGSGSHGLQVDNNGNVNVPRDSLVVYNDITSTHGRIQSLGGITSLTGGLEVRNDIISSTGYLSVANYIETQQHVTAQNDIWSVKGKVIAQTDLVSYRGDCIVYNNVTATRGKVTAGDKFVCQGEEGWHVDFQVVVRMNSTYYWTRQMKFKGGMLYSEGPETRHTI